MDRAGSNTDRWIVFVRRTFCAHLFELNFYNFLLVYFILFSCTVWYWWFVCVFSWVLQVNLSLCNFKGFLFTRNSVHARLHLHWHSLLLFTSWFIELCTLLIHVTCYFDQLQWFGVEIYALHLIFTFHYVLLKQSKQTVHSHRNIPWCHSHTLHHRFSFT
jgi:hypothetical protein